MQHSFQTILIPGFEKYPVYFCNRIFSNTSQQDSQYDRFSHPAYLSNFLLSETEILQIAIWIRTSHFKCDSHMQQANAR